MMGDSTENARNKLLIPYAGHNRNGVDFELLGFSTHLWSSSPEKYKYSVDKDKSYLLNLYISEYDYVSIIEFDRVVATPVRCFYDFYQPYTPSSTIIHT